MSQVFTEQVTWGLDFSVLIGSSSRLAEEHSYKQFDRRMPRESFRLKCKQNVRLEILLNVVWELMKVAGIIGID